MEPRESDILMLRVADRDGRRTILTAGSGLPGPRANLPLAHTYAVAAEDEAEVAAFAADPDEFIALCGAMAAAAHANHERMRNVAREAATDRRWRVREGVATGLQRLGGESPDALVAVLDAWRDDPHPLVARARIAAICEPPLLKDPGLAAAALQTCAEATAVLVASPHRRDGDVRTLRQALGYCWSVAVAADPASGLPAFAALDESDPDVAWVAKSNRSKARLAHLL